MKIHAKTSRENPNRVVANEPSPRKKGGNAAFQFVNNSPEARQLERLQEMSDNSPQVANTARLQAMADRSPYSVTPRTLQVGSSGRAVQKKANNTGLPDNLKSGIENLSGHSMDDVQVHYNSSKPAALQALAYTQGTDIHVGPGQEQHLPHEAWHVAQQRQGRVKPTMQVAEAQVNDDVRLEHEADVMGQRAVQLVKNARIDTALQSVRGEKRSVSGNGTVHQMAPVANDRLNVIGEDHSESEARIGREKRYLRGAAGGDGYWDEVDFKVGEFKMGWGRLIDRRQKGDPSWLHMEFLISGLVHNLRVNLGLSRGGTVLSMATHRDEHLWAWDSWMVFLDEVGKYLQTGFYDLSELQVTKLRDSLTAASAAKEKMIVLNEAVRTGAGQPKALNDAHNFVKAFYDELYGAIRAPDVVNDDRELSMHAAANAGSNRKGAWKIGEAHVQSLIDPAKAPRFDNKLYNVTSQAEFNRELP